MAKRLELRQRIAVKPPKSRIFENAELGGHRALLLCIYLACFEGIVVAARARRETHHGIVQVIVLITKHIKFF